MTVRLLIFALLAVAAATPVTAQTVEMVFTPAVVQQAVDLKSVLKVDKLESFSALALVGASPEQKKTYANKVARMTALVIIGDDALRATADMEFACPVIVVNSIGVSPAARRVVRIFDAPGAPASARPVSPEAITQAVASNGILKGDVGATVQALVGLLK